MDDGRQTKKQLLAELADLRCQVAELEKFRDLVEASSDIIMRFDREYRYLYVNRAVTFLSNLKPGEFVGKTPADLGLPEDFARQREQAIRTVFETKAPFETEFTLPGRQGVIVINARLFPEFDGDGNVRTVVCVSRDITRLNRMEAGLRASEERYRTIIENIEDGYHEVDLAGRFTFFNRSFQRMMKYSAEELMGMHYHHYAADEGIAGKIREAYNRVYKTGQAIERLEFDYIRGDGVRRTVEVSASLIRNDRGQPAGFRGIVRDNTDRKQVETLYRTLANTSRAGVYIVQDGKFRFINYNAAKYAGYSEEEMIGMDAVSIVFSEDRKTVAKNAAKMLNGELTVPYEFRILTKDGQIRWIMETVTSIVYQGRNAVLGNSMDITELKEARRRLEDSEQNLSQIIEGTSVPTFVLDKNHRIIHWNRACETLTGIPGRQVIGTNMQWSAFYRNKRSTMADFIVDGELEESFAAHYEGRQRKSALIEEGYEGEIFFPDLGLKGKWLFITAAPLKNLQGQIVGAIETLQDTTERKQMEEEIHLLSVTDHLTGLYNRRGFITLAEQQLKVSVRTRKRMLLCFADLDSMKRINDSWGHDEGDRVLVDAAVILKETFRDSDILARIGGDEFAVLSIDATDLTPEMLNFRLQDHLNQFNAREKRPYGLSLSIGVASYDPECPIALEELMCRADTQMYACKYLKKGTGGEKGH